MASSSGLRKRLYGEHNLSIVGGNWERITGDRHKGGKLHIVLVPSPFMWMS